MIMDASKTFERRPMTYEYEMLKSRLSMYCQRIIRSGHTPIQAVCGAFHYYFEERIEENGMDRVALMVLGFLFEVEHGEVDPDLVEAVKWHIEDFENGGYQSLFKKEDLELLQTDIERVKGYLKNYKQ